MMGCFNRVRFIIVLFRHSCEAGIKGHFHSFADYRIYNIHSHLPWFIDYGKGNQLGLCFVHVAIVGL